MFKKITLIAAVATVAALSMVSAVSAGTISNTVYATGGKANVKISWGALGSFTVSGTTYDQASDGKCIGVRYEVALVGLNSLPKTIGIACGSGEANGFSDGRYQDRTKGAWVYVCQMDRDGSNIRNCGSKKYYDDDTSSL